jgi:hypothetical protein
MEVAAAYTGDVDAADVGEWVCHGISWMYAYLRDLPGFKNLAGLLGDRS